MARGPGPVGGTTGACLSPGTGSGPGTALQAVRIPDPPLAWFFEDFLGAHFLECLHQPRSWRQGAMLLKPTWLAGRALPRSETSLQLYGAKGEGGKMGK